MALLCSFVFVVLLGISPSYQQQQHQHDVVVYGATPGGVLSAYAAAKNGVDVALIVVLGNKEKIGGMCTNGLGHTDTGGDSRANEYISGYTKMFFERNGKHYNQPIQYNLEPHVAQNIFMHMLAEVNVTIYYNKELQSATKQGTFITSITCTDGSQYLSDVFIDGTYEGDLFAIQGADGSYAWGRESNTTYNEPYNGRLYYSPKNQFDVRDNPYEHGDSGEIAPLVYTGDAGVPGQADKKVQAYNFRLCITKNKTNSVEFIKPTNYNSSEYLLLSRLVILENLHSADHLFNIGAIPNDKYDMNNAGGISTDFIGMSWSWPTADWTDRMKVFQQHKDYHQGLLYFLSHDESIPKDIQQTMSEWGLCKDEWVDNGNWPYELYVREGKRLIGDKIFTQHSATTDQPFGSQSVGVGTYHFDTHNAQRIPCKKGTFHCWPSTHEPSPVPYVVNEGDLEVSIPCFEIPFWVALPKKTEFSNLMVPVAVSASHIGFASLRLEPTWMTIGHSVGTAAAIYVKGHRAGSIKSVQDIPLAELRKQLVSEGMIVNTKPS